MKTIFGTQTNDLLFALLIVVSLILAILVWAGLRNQAMLKLALRNIPGRRMQSALIVVGLALSTVITTSALITGDTLTYSLRRGVVDALGPIDEVISPVSVSSLVSGAGGAGLNGAGDLSDLSSIPFISQTQYESLRDQIKDEPLIDGFAPLFLVPGVIRNTTSGQGEPIGFVVGVGPEYEQQFGLHTVDGRSVNTADLRPGLGDLVETASSLLTLAEAQGLDVGEILAGLGEFPALEGQASDNPLDYPGGHLRQLTALNPGQATSLVLEVDRVLGQVGLELRRGEVYLDQNGAKKLAAHVGDELQVMLGPFPIPVRVKDILVDAGPFAPFGRPVVVMPIGETQKLLSILGLNDKYVAIVVSNKGGTLDSIEHRELDQPGMSDALRLLLTDAGLGVWIGNLPLPVETQARLKALTRQANPLSVEPFKTMALQLAEQAGDAAAQLFIFAGAFSLLAGVLLIFLVFVMLAASRKSEMGIARAVGVQRRHLIQMFVTEGAAYDLVAAVVGVVLGIGISYVMVSVIARIVSSVSSLGSVFQVQFYMEPRSLLIAFCLGLLFTLAIVTFASWRVSRLNIVSAIRDLPEEAVPGRRTPLLRRLWSAARGPLLILLGAALVYQGFTAQSESTALLGLSLAIAGLGLSANELLRRTSLRAARRERLAFSFMGLGLLLVWAVPWTSLFQITWLNKDGRFFIFAGVMMIAGAIWTVMYNADLLLWAINWSFGRFGLLAPVLKTAIAYPLSARFRTGLAMAMFAIVIFLVITMAVVIRTQQTLFSASEAETAGFDIRATTTSPIADLAAAVQNQPDAPAADIVAIGWSASRFIEARQAGAARQGWFTSYPLVGVDAGFIDQAQASYTLKMRAPGYASDQAVWQALAERDDVVVVTSLLIPFGELDTTSTNTLYLEGVGREDQQLPPITLEVRNPNANEAAVTSYHVIAVLNENTTAAGSGILANEHALARLTEKPASPGTYYLKVRQGADAAAIAQAMEKAFQLYGLDARTYEEINLETQGSSLAILQLLQGFMALGLLVGIAALGVISSRNVVERRQQVGVLRAIGYRPGMVGLSFVLESSFVSVCGILIGTALGLVLSANMLNSFSSAQAGLAFSPPWAEILTIILLAYGFSLLTTIIPAYQAARIYPAEALRYE